jgi:hypothetical protein
MVENITTAWLAVNSRIWRRLNGTEDGRLFLESLNGIQPLYHFLSDENGEPVKDSAPQHHEMLSDFEFSLMCRVHRLDGASGQDHPDLKAFLDLRANDGPSSLPWCEYQTWSVFLHDLDRLARALRDEAESDLPEADDSDSGESQGDDGIQGDEEETDGEVAEGDGGEDAETES